MQTRFENPLSRESVDLMRAHIANVAKENDIVVKYIPGPIKGDGSGDPRTQTIRVPVINGPVSYAIALHELGHLLDPMGSLQRANYATIFNRKTGLRTPWDNDLYILEEAFAWEWAMKNALTWTPSMSRTARWGFETYTKARVLDERSYNEFMKDPHNAEIMNLASLADDMTWSTRRHYTRADMLKDLKKQRFLDEITEGSSFDDILAEVGRLLGA